MDKQKGTYKPPYLTVDYSLLGIMTLDEFKQALWTDLNVLKDAHNVKFVKAPTLRLEFTNEYGERAILKGLGDGKPIYRMHTRHYRPACLDYDP